MYCSCVGKKKCIVVHEICLLFLRYFLGILTAHVRKSNSELDIALRKIQALKGSINS